MTGRHPQVWIIKQASKFWIIYTSLQGLFYKNSIWTTETYFCRNFNSGKREIQIIWMQKLQT